jgi:pimeloyl-ACP methyl ester carboxylesterase
MNLDPHVIKLSDGRDLEVATMGDPSGPTVVLQHGTPGSFYTLAGHAAAWVDRGLFFVLTSRAGYGNSSRREGRRAHDVVGDVHEALDTLERDSYVTLGFSGGGPHALACAALGAPRCRGAISAAGVAPNVADFDWTEGMNEEARQEFDDFLSGGPDFEASIMEGYEHFKNCTPDNMMELWQSLFSEVDIAAMRADDQRIPFGLGTGHAFVNGPWGYYDDNVSTMSDWGFSLRDITVPVGVWYGNEDLMVPARHGDYLSATILTARPHYYPAEGHMSIVSQYRDAIADEMLSFFE